MSKLEVIKQNFKDRNSFDNVVSVGECKISLEDYHWLIEQVEKYEEYFQENSVEAIEEKMDAYGEELLKLCEED